MTSTLVPQRSAVHRDAKASLDALHGWVKSNALEAWLRNPRSRAPAAPFRATASLYAGNDAVADWDTAVQAYLLLVALDQAGRDKMSIPNRPRTDKQGEILKALRTVRLQLAFPEGDDSPTTFSGRIGDQAAPREEIKNQLREIHTLLQADGAN